MKSCIINIHYGAGLNTGLVILAPESSWCAEKGWNRLLSRAARKIAVIGSSLNREMAVANLLFQFGAGKPVCRGMRGAGL